MLRARARNNGRNHERRDRAVSDVHRNATYRRVTGVSSGWLDVPDVREPTGRKNEDRGEEIEGEEKIGGERCVRGDRKSVGGQRGFRVAVAGGDGGGGGDSGVVVGAL